MQSNQYEYSEGLYGDNQGHCIICDKCILDKIVYRLNSNNMVLLFCSFLTDEDDSILLSGSPLSRSLHQDGMEYMNVTPPAQNLIDI